MENPYEEREAQLRQLELRSSELLLRGEFEIGEEVANEFLALAKNASDQWHSWAHLRLGTILENAGRYKEAELHARAAQAAVSIDSPSWTQAAGLLGNIYLNQRDYPAARTQFLQTLDSLPDSSFALCGLSSIESLSDNLDSGRQYALRALESACRTDDREHMSVAHNLLGGAELDLGNTTKAEKHFRNALAISEELSRRRGISVACDHLSEIECERNNYGLGLEYGQRAVAAEMEMGRRENVYRVSFWLAFRLDGAELPEVLLGGITLCQTAFRAATEPIDRAWALRQQSRFQSKLEQFDEAEASLKQAIQHLEVSDKEMANTFGMLGFVQRKRKNFEAARESFARSLELAKEYHHFEIERSAHGSLGDCAFAKGDVVRARHHWQLALKLAELEANQEAVVNLRETLGSCPPSLVGWIRFWLLDRWRK